MGRHCKDGMRGWTSAVRGTEPGPCAASTSDQLCETNLSTLVLWRGQQAQGWAVAQAVGSRAQIQDQVCMTPATLGLHPRALCRLQIVSKTTK